MRARRITEVGMDDDDDDGDDGDDEYDNGRSIKRKQRSDTADG